jgi:large subunit ribosomal protein L20
MARVKNAVNALKTRRNVLAQAKGFRFSRSKKEKAAYEALAHAGNYARRHRREKKGEFRALWNVRLNGALHPLGMSYSKFIGALKKAQVELDRKVLSQIAAESPNVFASIVSKVK